MSDTPGIQQQLATDSMLPEIPYKGTLWKVGRPDGDAKGRLEKLAQAVAINEVRDLKGVLGADAYAEAFAEVTTNLKRYATWRPAWQKIVFDPANAHLFLWSLLQAHHPRISEDEVKELAREAPEEVQFALAQVIPGFFSVLLAGLELNPDQRAAVAKSLDAFRARLTPTPSESTPSETPA